MSNLCFCGCGTQANLGKWFIGHWNRGRVHSKEWSMKAWNTKRKRYGKHPPWVWNRGVTKYDDERMMHLSIVSKLNAKERGPKISIAKKGIPNLFAKGKKRPKEVCKRIREGIIRSYENPNRKITRYWLGKKITFPHGMKGKHHTKKAKAIIKKKRLLQVIPTKDTSIEKKVQSFLTEKNIIFEKHKAITGQPDIFIQPNICIFTDGCYWHGCPKCNKIQTKFADRKYRDKTITSTLSRNGYQVIRFWEHTINNDFDTVKDVITNAV